ncbi:hypothetical protein C0992_004041, partial [Termitomyces sp. T32_za158]
MRRRIQCSRDYEERLQAAIQGVAEGKYKSYAVAARDLKVNPKTLSDRAREKHQSHRQGFEKRQLLSAEQEEVLLAWAKKASLSGEPFSIQTLAGRVKDICGVLPGKNWRHRFIRRHPRITLAKPNGLDPKHAENFNRTTVADYYKHWSELEERYPQGIPPEHKWNMDKKGLQFGGGCQNSGKKYFYFRHRKQRYRIRSDNLELATVTECISAAGLLSHL